MDETRRGFLKAMGCVAAVGGGFPLLRALASSRTAPPPPAAGGRKQWGMVIDVRKCLDKRVVHACTQACRREHNLPVDPNPERQIKWIWTETYESAFPDQAHAHPAAAIKEQPVLLLCNHCTKPACVKVCPTKATWKRKSDGIVMMDMHRCIGCRYCIAACPYGSRSFNWRDARPHVDGQINPDYPTRSRGVVEKCNFCAERIRADREPVPACVEAVQKLSEQVPSVKGALTFGDLSDETSTVSKLLRENHTICRHFGLGTEPNVFYIV